ncbi:MAG TPA: alkaline phosphatase family protein [Pyrinomonadaceae bacterium]|nr:alkaline phosphatase family protein [Pyrinomonadaceae bacterium]
MSFELPHTLISRRFTPETHQSGKETFFTVSLKGEFPVLFTGQLRHFTKATFKIKERAHHASEPIEGQPSDPGSTPLHGGFETVDRPMSLTLRIFTPDGQEFTGNKITLADLRKFRDLRGLPSGRWSYKLTGESEHVGLEDEDEFILDGGDPKGSLFISLNETVASESAPPLIKNVAIAATLQSFQFDLFRVGEFVAEISQAQIGAPWNGSMRLLDPDSVVVASTTGRQLKFTVNLPTLNKSRDAEGKVRKWTLEVSPHGGVVVGSPHLLATVIAKGRITIAALKSRINALLGPDGSFIEIFGQNKGGEILARLRDKDIVSAETIDMHGLLEDVLSDVIQDGAANPHDFEANVLYTLGRRSEIFNVHEEIFEQEIVDVNFRLDCSTLRVGSIKVDIGPGEMLGASVPAIKLRVAVSGALTINLGDLTVAEGGVRGGEFAMEVGIKLSSNGTPKIITAVSPSPLDIDLKAGAKAVLALTNPFLAAIVDDRIETKERKINDDIVAGAKGLFSDPTLASRILMMIFGAHFKYEPFRIERDEIVFDHIAPVEPEPKPTPGYQGAIGRSFTRLTPGAITFTPPLLEDTWRADNLHKVKHIVVVMMENRSYDHVLGYRARRDINDGADGLTDEMIATIEAAPDGNFDVRALRNAGFPKNEIGKMTRLPLKVGHELDDVEQQLRSRADGPGDGQINSPKGFVENFKPRLEPDSQGVVANDVLGFYDEKDLPFFAFLAENYAYCDRYYSSHPGPTLPNRMYSLTGDLQHDRFGFPIPDTNNSDNFLLSRAPTIYDVLARNEVSFRIYESFPSITMLRMFARYATDTTHIVPFDRLEADTAPAGRGLPAFTVIEPQMHAHPQDDDHPDADMHRGQLFLKKVYDTLTSNRALWEKTLLIITYDEHGGLYDHVVPPLADVYTEQSKPVVEGSGAVVTATPVLPAPLTIPYGVRVPTFVVSPWTGRGKGRSLTLDHCSILKTVLARFLGAKKPFLSDRVSASHSFESFLTETVPRMNVPPSPSLLPLPIGDRRTPSPTTKIVTRPLSRKEMREGPVDYHELTGRWARQLGR